MSETLKDLLEYLQNKIDSGEHKIFYNDLGWDIKIIDCINAINEQQEEIERLNKKIEQYENPEDMTLMFMWCDEKAKDEIKRLNNIINELEKKLLELRLTDVDGRTIVYRLLDKLQELKGSDKE